MLVVTDLDRALAPAFSSVPDITSQSQLAEPSLAGPFAEEATEGRAELGGRGLEFGPTSDMNYATSNKRFSLSGPQFPLHYLFT